MIKSEKTLYIKIVKIRRSLRRPVNSSSRVTVVTIYDTADIAKFDRRREVKSDTQVNMRARRKGKKKDNKNEMRLIRLSLLMDAGQFQERPSNPLMYFRFDEIRVLLFLYPGEGLYE